MPVMRVLLIEDDDAVRLHLEGWLIDDGHEVVAVATAEEALVEFGRMSRPVHVVTDFNLPGMSGVELIQRLADHDRHGVPVICSGNIKDATTLLAGKSRGAVAVAKPFRSMELLEALDRTVAFDPQRMPHTARIPKRARP